MTRNQTNKNKTKPDATTARGRRHEALQRLDERRTWRDRQWARRNRSAAWLIQQALQEADTTHTFVKPPRIARCGWPLGHTRVQLSEGKASVQGLEHCASPWACPICAPVIRIQRATDLQQAASRWTAQGHGLLFITLTRPHTKTEPLTTGMDIVDNAWSYMIASQRWRIIKAQFGIRHWARSIEITRNPKSGWHAHIHMLAFTDQPEPDVKEPQHWLLELWNTTLQRYGSRPASKRHGVTVLSVRDTPGRVAIYMTKAPDRIGAEITRMDAKNGRGHSFAPFQLLDQPVINGIGEDKAKRLWLEYVNATRGQRSITWSRLLRTELVGGIEQSDRQIIDNTLQGMSILEIPNNIFRQLKREPSVLSFILSRIETGEIPLAEDIIDNTQTTTSKRANRP